MEETESSFLEMCIMSLGFCVVMAGLGSYPKVVKDAAAQAERMHCTSVTSCVAHALTDGEHEDATR